MQISETMKLLEELGDEEPVVRSRKLQERSLSVQLHSLWVSVPVQDMTSRASQTVFFPLTLRYDFLSAFHADGPELSLAS